MYLQVEVPDEIWLEFKKAVRKKKGRVKGVLKEAVIEALKLYIKSNHEPETKSETMEELLLTKEQRMILKALREYDEVILDDISKIVSMFTIENYEANIEFAKKFLQPIGNDVYKVNKEKIKEVL